MNNAGKIDESMLIHGLKNSNIHAFNALYKEYSDRLFRFALGYLKSESEAEELVQEVFTKIWEKRTTIQEELSFKSFLFTIAFNLIRKHFRTKGYLSRYSQSLAENGQNLQSSQDEGYNSLINYVNSLISQLPAKRREILIKSRFEGYSIKEISEKLKISHKTVENQLTDALRFLRTNLNNENIPVILFFILFIDF
ncbi:MAG: RNA polymerase sigma-70 factor [Prolixibacteraceae bacterium]